MKETNYESVMEKKRREIGISTKVKAQKHKREQSKKKPEIKKKKGIYVNFFVNLF